MIQMKRLSAFSFISVFLLFCTGIYWFSAPRMVDAAITETELINENFHGESIDYYNWRFQENVGIDLIKDSSVVQMLEPLNGTGITTVAEYGENGISTELDFRYLQMASTGFFGLVFGSDISIENASTLGYILSEEQKKPCTFLYFTLTDGVLGMVIYDFLGTDLGAVGQYGERIRFSAGTYYFDDFTIAEPDESIALREQTLCVQYGNNGALRISVKDTHGEGNGFLLAEIGAGKLPAVNGHVGLVTMEPGVNLEMVQVKISDADGKNESCLRDDSDVLAGVFTKFEYAGTERFYAGQDNYINFTPDSDEDSTLIYRQAVQASANVEKNVVALQFSFCPKEIKGNKKFEVRFGLSRLSDNSDSPDSYAVRFSQKDGDLYYSVEYNCQPDGYENASTVLKVEEKLLPYAPGEDWQVKIEQDYNGFMRIYFDGELYSSVYGLPVPNGYIGFMQSGGTTNDDNYIDVNLDNIKVTNRYDERPENTNIDLDFETGDMNLNEWQISSNASYGRIGGVYVADGVLHFDNVGNDSKIVTKHRYANFEMTFDIVDLRREAVIDDFGNKLYPVSSVFGIMFGIETYAATFMSMYMQSPILSFQTSIDADTWEKDGGTSVTLYGSDSNDPGTVLPDKYDFFDKNNAGKIINVSVSLIDSHLILKIKYSDESEWYTVYEKDFSKSYVGYIAIWGMGAGSEADQISCGQFTLDNLKITNKDSSPNLIEVPFESNRPTPPGDYVYIDRNDDDEFLIENMEIPKE